MDCSLTGSSVHGIFPGKSTGVGCHCLLHHFSWVYACKWNCWIMWKFHVELFDKPQTCFLPQMKVSQSCPTLLRPHGLYSPWDSLGHNTGVGSLYLLQGIFPAQGLNPGLPHYRRVLYQLSHKGSPRILEWVAYPFSSRSSWYRNQTQVSCIAGRFFTNWAIREATFSAAKLGASCWVW